MFLYETIETSWYRNYTKLLKTAHTHCIVNNNYKGKAGTAIILFPLFTTSIYSSGLRLEQRTGTYLIVSLKLSHYIDEV